MPKIKEMNDLYKETLTVLAYFDDTFIEKIPFYVFQKLNEMAADSDAVFYIDKNKTLEEQLISEECKNLICLLYYQYIADDVEKQEILKQLEENEKRYQNILCEKYSVDDLFKNKKEDIKQIDSNQMQLVEYTETLIDKIKKIFRKICKK